jgi:hypothetical protein
MVLLIGQPPAGRRQKKVAPPLLALLVLDLTLRELQDELKKKAVLGARHLMAHVRWPSLLFWISTLDFSLLTLPAPQWHPWQQQAAVATCYLVLKISIEEISQL